MSADNNNTKQPIAVSGGETVEQAAANFAKENYPDDVYRVMVIFKAVYQWQATQPTPKVPALATTDGRSVDVEQLDKLVKDEAQRLMSEYDDTDRKLFPIDDESYINGCIIGARFGYALRSAQQVDAVQVIEEKFEELAGFKGNQEFRNEWNYYNYTQHVLTDLLTTLKNKIQ